MFGRASNAKPNVTQASAWVTYLLLVVGIVSPVVCVVWLVRTAVENENAVVRRLVAEANERRLSDAEAIVSEVSKTLSAMPENGGVVFSWSTSSESIPEEEMKRARAVLTEVRGLLQEGASAVNQELLTGYLNDRDVAALRLGGGRRLGAILVQLGLKGVSSGDELEAGFAAAADRYVADWMGHSDLSRQHRYLLRQYGKLSASPLVVEIFERELLTDEWVEAAEARGVFPPEAGLSSYDGFVLFKEPAAETARIFRKEVWIESVANREQWTELGVELVAASDWDGEGRLMDAPLDFVALSLKEGVAGESSVTQSKAVLYLWIGGIVLMLSILSGVAIVFSVRRQASVTQLKDNLVATVTHELKTPVSSIRLLVDTLMDEGRREKVNTREYIELISRENQRLGRLIDNFLSFSRMERSKGSFDIRRVSPTDVLTSAEEAFRERFKGQRFDLSIEQSEQLPDIAGDPDALSTVIGNLLENALKYGGREKRIELSCNAVADGVEFQVRDYGKGISKRDQKRIFRKFFQVDHHASGQSGSVGLGLSIVEFIVSKHSGQIELESELGKGSVFKIRIPYA